MTSVAATDILANKPVNDKDDKHDENSYIRLRSWQTTVPVYPSWDDQLDLDSDVFASEAEMSSPWSSAATGKPHVSYAERLRLAKETSLKPAPKQAEIKAGEEHGAAPSLSDHLSKVGTSITNKDQSSSHSLFERNSVASSSLPQTSASMSPNPSSNNTAGTSSPARSVADLPSQPTEQPLPTKGAPVVNIWDQRRKLLESDKIETPSAGPRASAGQSNRKDGRERAASAPRRAWGEVGVVDGLKDRIDNTKLNGATDAASSEAGMGTSNAVTKVIEQGGLSTDSRAWPSPLASTTRRRVSDPSDWPEISEQHRSQSHARSIEAGQQDEHVEGASKSGSLDHLDVKICNGGSERQRKDGKQWVAIVPTITHAKPAPRQSPGNGNRRTKTGQGRTTGTAKASSVPQTPSNRSVSNGTPVSPPTSKGSHLPNETRRKASAAGDQVSTSTGPSSRKATGSSDTPALRTTSRPRTPRGARGRGGSKRSDEAQSSDKVFDGEDGVETFAASPASSERLAALAPSLPHRPAAESVSDEQRSGDSDGAAMATDRKDGKDAVRAAQPVRRMSSPYQRGGAAKHVGGQQWGFRPYAAPYDIPVMESTPVQSAPSGTQTSLEPTAALLWQLEFYFSHQNLQGDFYLRKSMDQHGFVPIQVVSTFNRVVQLAGEGKADLITRTLQFSKALQFSEDRTKIRKAYGWEPYVLTEGVHAQDFMPFGHTAAAAQAHAPASQQWSGWKPNAYGRPSRDDGKADDAQLDVGGVDAVPDAEKGKEGVKEVEDDEEEDEGDQSDEADVGLVSATGLGGMLSKAAAGQGPP